MTLSGFPKEDDERKSERRRTDTSIKVVFYLLGLIQAIALAWIYKVDGKVEKIPFLEANVINIQMSVNEIKMDVKDLLRRK